MSRPRFLLPLGIVVALAAHPVAAQRVELQVTLSNDTLVDGRLIRLPQVRTLNLLAGRWGQALRNSLPLRLSYQIEIWRSRDGWIDQYEKTVEWGIVVRHEALFDQYTVTTPRARGAPEVSLATWEALDRYLSRERLILARPGGRGTYYFHVRLEVTTLSEDDLEELERFVRGEGTDPDRDRNPANRSVLQFLMRMTGGLQSERVEQRTEKFVVR
ncbi:MAG: DUF4390 domain-containing protein [Gemmatimonadota bacterium]|nr:DUF4390 domain-containing protein [Gemmatimonadota bacterium]